ncbi:MAG: CRISPR-associated helicase Cas3' [Caldilineaceae bacterium]
MQLYNYQKKVAKLLRQGKNVILKAPTGTGKTLASLWPFIEAWDRNQPTVFPRKCIYSVPMRVLANQFKAEIHKLITEEMVLAEPPEDKIQTGEQSQDPKFLGDLIFATIDQSLSSALAVPYSLSPGMANLNAGAFYASYLIFDEFHLFPLADDAGAEGALTTVLQLLMEVKGIVPFVLMTATFSSTMLHELAHLLDAEVVQVSREEYAAIAAGGTGKMRSRHYCVHETTLSPQAILAQHQQRTLVICNQVQRAQELFLALQTATKGTAIQVELLHSRFLPADRQAKEERIRREFGKDRTQWSVDSMIVVATQVIEVGLDITCETLHTEIAPANAIFQRAGRCARYPGEQGTVHLYAVPTRERAGVLYPDYLPYPKSLCEGAWQSFLPRSGQVLDFEDEQEVIDEVHTTSDRELLAAMQRQRGVLWQDIYAAMQEGAREQRRNLIRRIDNITVLAAPIPTAAGNPFRAQGFGLWRGTVKGLLRTLEEYAQEWQPAEDAQNWLMQFPLATTPNPDDPTELVTINWQEVTDASLLDGTALVVINSAFCAYDADLGFRIVPPEAGGWASAAGEFKQRNSQDGFSYALESYTDHIGNMLKVYRRDFATDYAYIEQRLAQAWDLPPTGLTKAIQSAIALHDLAKMDKRWQRWVRLYQQGIGEPITDDSYMAVHTHWSPIDATHRTAKQQADRQCKRPPHAGESAVAGAMIVAELCGHDDLTRAVLTAITRHHSAQAHEFRDYELHPAAAKAAVAALALTDLGPIQNALIAKAPPIRLEDYLVEPQKFQALLLYLWIARMLRLCDGLSQED